MSTKSIRRSGVRIRVPERVRLFFVNCFRSAPCKKARKFLFELYMYSLLRPYFQYQLGHRTAPLQYLFVLSPMRSGSSLLVHLLNSNLEIEGYGESHCPYTTYRDLEKLIYRTAVIQGSLDFKNAVYVMDKLVRNHELSDAILGNKHAKFIFLLRDPAASFKSTTQLSKTCLGLRKYQDFNIWLDYYQARLDCMQNLAKRINDKDRCLFVQYEELLYQTDETLQKFQSFLETQTPFSENYKLSKHTGNLRYGDPSDVMKSGKISRQKENINESSIIGNQEVQELAYKAHRHCITALSQRAQTISDLASVSG